MQTNARLNARLLVGRNHEVIVCQELALPEPLIEIQYPFCFGLKVGIAREDPTAMLPGANGILIEPSPDGAAADPPVPPV